MRVSDCARVHGIEQCLYLHSCANVQARIVQMCVCMSLFVSLSLSLSLSICVRVRDDDRVSLSGDAKQKYLSILVATLVFEETRGGAVAI